MAGRSRSDRTGIGTLPKRFAVSALTSRVLRTLKRGANGCGDTSLPRRGCDMAKNRPDLTISPDEVFFILLKARELDAKVEFTDPAAGAELLGAIRGLNDDQR